VIAVKDRMGEIAAGLGAGLRAEEDGELGTPLRIRDM